jgi:hypothetical protein
VREESGSAVLDAAAVRAQKPFDQPARPKKSPAPLFHAFTRRVRSELYEAYHLFLAAFRDAADRLRAGDRTARFPLGSFPPAIPFVSALPLSEPLDSDLRDCPPKSVCCLTPSTFRRSRSRVHLRRKELQSAIQLSSMSCGTDW